MRVWGRFPAGTHCGVEISPRFEVTRFIICFIQCWQQNHHCAVGAVSSGSLFYLAVNNRSKKLPLST